MRRLVDLPVSSRIYYLVADARKLLDDLFRAQLLPQLGELVAVIAELAVEASDAYDEVERLLGAEELD